MLLYTFVALALSSHQYFMGVTMRLDKLFPRLSSMSTPNCVVYSRL
jgi:hypothetical protein